MARMRVREGAQEEAGISVIFQIIYVSSLPGTRIQVRRPGGMSRSVRAMIRPQEHSVQCQRGPRSPTAHRHEETGLGKERSVLRKGRGGPEAQGLQAVLGPVQTLLGERATLFPSGQTPL